MRHYGLVLLLHYHQLCLLLALLHLLLLICFQVTIHDDCCYTGGVVVVRAFSPPSLRLPVLHKENSKNKDRPHQQHGRHHQWDDQEDTSTAHAARVTTTTAALLAASDDIQGKEEDDDEDNGSSSSSSRIDRRAFVLKQASSLLTATTATTAICGQPEPANAESITSESNWPLWPALPVAPYARRKTIRKQVVPERVWIFDQLIGIYYVHVPIRMTVCRIDAPGKGGLLVYAPVAPTLECQRLLQELIDAYGPIRDIILPTVAVEHKVLAGPFARTYPQANFFVTDKQYSFPIPLPDQFLGLPPWTKPLPTTSSTSSSTTTTTTVNNNNNNRQQQLSSSLLSSESSDFSWQVLTVQPGPASMYQDVALLHKSSKTLLVCDAIFATTSEPPAILQEEPDYVKALLFHARDAKDEIPEDTPENRRKGWRRIVLLFNFFFPGSGKADLGLRPVWEAIQTPTYKYGWGGWMPFVWPSVEKEILDFNTYTEGGKPTIYTIVQIILARGPNALEEWLSVIKQWEFERVIPAHLDAPLEGIGPQQFVQTFDFLSEDNKGKGNFVRFCDEDVTFLRQAEEGFLNFSVFPTKYGPLRGKNGPCGLLL